jgi:non-specific serine/threonine protein kinase
LEALIEAGPHEALGGIPLFYKHALAGEAEEALSALDERTRTIAWDDPDFPYWLAGPFALIGRTDLALEWLQHALDRGFINYPFLVETGPFLENLRREDRFHLMVEEVKAKWESFEV